MKEDGLYGWNHYAFLAPNLVMFTTNATLIRPNLHHWYSSDEETVAKYVVPLVTWALFDRCKSCGVLRNLNIVPQTRSCVQHCLC